MYTAYIVAPGVPSMMTTGRGARSGPGLVLSHWCAEEPSSAVGGASPHSPDLTSLVALCSELCEVGDVLLDLGPGLGCGFISNGEPAGQPESSLLAFSVHLSRHDQVLIIDDVRADEREFATRLFLHDPVKIAYAGIPVHGPSGDRAGTLVLARRVGSAWKVSVEKLELLSRVVSQVIAGAKAADDLERASSRRATRTDAILHDALGVTACVRWGLQAIECRQPQNRRALGMQIEAIDELLRLLQSMRQFGHAPETSQRVRSIDLYTWFRNLTERASIEASSQGLVVDASCRVPRGMAEVSPELLNRLVRNLYVNAMEASPPGGTVFLHFRMTDSGSFRLEIADEGPGIAESEYEIFSPGFTRDKQNGTGLGLAICREIARLMNGQLSYQARQPNGCRFVFEFRSSGRNVIAERPDQETCLV